MAAGQDDGIADSLPVGGVVRGGSGFCFSSFGENLPPFADVAIVYNSVGELVWEKD